ncbi:MAG: NrfD/PsrC family molybdoenzyme membrane anchor subunit [Candidatus Zhuqueibacterota bacterium]
MPNKQDKLIGNGSIILIVLIALGLIVALIRYFFGLGAISNLSDAYPWGIWISFDLLCGVALAAGAFVTAAAVHIFGGETMKPLLRPAILTGFLGYVLVVLALLVDLGQYQRIWHLLIFWNLHSPLFEVGWCVMTYTTVLALEFVPIVLERYKLKTPLKFFKKISIGLIIAGIVLSTMHQSSLGTMFLIMPEKLHALWHTPFIPVLFLTSAIAVGIAMVIFESTISTRVFKRESETAAQGKLALGLPWVLGLYFIMKIADLAAQGELGLIVEGSKASYLFMLELIIGVIIPFFIFLSKSVRKSTKAMFNGSLFVIAGLILNRFNVSLFSIKAPEQAWYFPHLMEILITTGIVSAGIFAYYLIARHFPVFAEEH